MRSARSSKNDSEVVRRERVRQLFRMRLPEELTETGVGGRHRSEKSSRASLTSALPIVLKAAVEMRAAQGQDGVGSPEGPEHSGLLEA